MGRSGLIRLPQSPWEATLYLGVVLQLVVSLFLLTGSYTGVQSAVVRDIYIVGALSLVSVLVLAFLLPMAASRKGVRRGLFALVLVVLLVSVLGAVSQAVTPWTVVPSLILVLGALLLFRQVQHEGVPE